MMSYITPSSWSRTRRSRLVFVFQFCGLVVAFSGEAYAHTRDALRLIDLAPVLTILPLLYASLPALDVPHLRRPGCWV